MNTAIVTCVELDENVYVGGVLVIDSDGFPLEFQMLTSYLIVLK